MTTTAKVEIIENGKWVRVHVNAKGTAFHGQVCTHCVESDGLVMYTVKLANGEVVKENHYMVHEIMHPTNVKVGEGATLCLYSDRYACTVSNISKKGKQITLQRDTATRITKPEIIPGGFAGHCTNNDEIEYTYARNEKGATYTANWSEKRGKFVVGGAKGEPVMQGRDEKYDYNF